MWVRSWIGKSDTSLANTGLGSYELNSFASLVSLTRNKLVI